MEASTSCICYSLRSSTPAYLQNFSPTLSKGCERSGYTQLALTLPGSAEFLMLSKRFIVVLEAW